MAALLLDIARAYALIGLAVAMPFLIWGIGRIDANAAGAWVFRPLLLPGVILIWPLVLWRWRALARGWDEARRHRPPRRVQDRMGLALAVALPLIFALALAVRQDRDAALPSVRLSAPTEAGQ